MYSVLEGSPSNAAELRWIWFSGFAVILVLALLVIIQHMYFGFFYKFTITNLFKLVGAFLVLLGLICVLIFVGVNPYGVVFGYPTKYDLIGSNISLTLSLFFIGSAISIATANWIWIAYNATVPMARVSDGWPWISKVLCFVVGTTLFVYGIASALLQVNTQGLVNANLYLFAALIIAMCLVAVISGALVIVTIRDIESSDPKLLKRTSIQLVTLASFEMLAAILLIVVLSLPTSVYTTFAIYFGITQAFTYCLFYLVNLSLLLGFRIAAWQLKEVALPRPNTVASNSGSSVAGSKRFGDSKAESASKGVSGQSLTDDQESKAKPLQDSVSSTGKDTGAPPDPEYQVVDL